MGYYTYYSLNLIEGDENEFGRMVEEIKEKTDIDFSNDGEEAKWYDWAGDMKELSKKHPALLVQLDGSGEDAGDVWSARFRNGDMECVEASVPPFTELINKGETEQRKQHASTENQLKALMEAAAKILENLSYTQEEDYEPDCEKGYNDPGHLADWVKKVGDEAEEWLRTIRK